MKRSSLRFLLLLVVPFSASCSLTGPPDKRTCDWSPPEDGLIDMSSPDFTNARLWVSPNPLAIQPWEGGGLTEIMVVRLGGDAVTLEDMRIEGSPDFHTGLIPSLSYPHEIRASHCCHSDGCGCCGHFGSILEYTSSGEEPGESWFVVETSGPGASTVRVPIIVDHEGLYTHPDPHHMWNIRDVAAIAVSPNPVKFDLASPGDMQVQNLCLNSTLGSTEITELRVIGDGLRLTNARDRSDSSVSMGTPFEASVLDTVDVEYVSDGTHMDGMLVLSFINEHGKEMTLGVPVMTCE